MISQEGGRLSVSGSLTMDTAATLLDIGEQLSGETIAVIDLSQVKVVDSAAVSLMLGWLREGQRSKVNLCFDHVPENLLSLARLYGVIDLLPLCQDNVVQA